MNKNLTNGYQQCSVWPALGGYENQLFKGLFNDFLGVEPAKTVGKTFTPKINIEEKETAYLVSAEVPGLAEDDLTVTCDRDQLTISGQKREDFKREENGMHFVGRSYGSFSKTIPLKVAIDADKIEAKLEKGILSISLPKIMETADKNKKINIQTVN